MSKEKSAAYDYFEKKLEGGKEVSVCKVDGCNKKLAGRHAGNLKSHLRSCHTTVYEMVQATDDEIIPNAAKTKRLAESEPAQSAKRQVSIIEAFGLSKAGQKTLTITMDAKTFERACVKMVTIDGCPFRLMDGAGFRDISNPITAALGIKMDRKTVVEKLAGIHKVAVKNTKTLLNQRLIFIKLDIATRMERTFLGINAQFEHNGTVRVVTLKILELHERVLSAEFLRAKLESVLAEFDVPAWRVVSITTDNGSNVLKIANLMSSGEEAGPASDDEADDSDTESEDEESDRDTPESTNPVADLDTENELYVDEDESNPLTPSLHENVDVVSTRCAAHTIELAAKDVMKMRNVQSALAKARKVVKKLRTRKFKSLPMRRYGKKAILDNATRWGSKYDMISRLTEMKDGLEEWGISNPDLRISAAKWETLEAIKSVLEPIRYAVTVLQREQLTPGDFYKVWLQTKLSVKKTGNSQIARKLIERMEIRERKLIEMNPVMTAGIYCDPRFTSTLSEDYVKIARETLLKLALKVFQVNEIDQDIDSEDTARSVTEEIEQDDLEAFLQGQERSSAVEHQELQNFSVCFMQALDLFEKIPRVRDSRDMSTKKFFVMDWWKDQVHLSSVRDIAMTVSSLPATQVSVERLFSALAIILTDKRNRIGAGSLDAVLFLRVNGLDIDL